MGSDVICLPLKVAQDKLIKHVCLRPLHQKIFRIKMKSTNEVRICRALQECLDQPNCLRSMFIQDC